MSSKNVPTILSAAAALRARRPLPSSSFSPATVPVSGAPAAPSATVAASCATSLGVVASRLMAFLREGGWWSIEEIAGRLAARSKSAPATHTLKRRVSDVLCVALMLGRVACVSRKTPAGGGQFRFVRCYSATDASVDLLDPSMDSLLNAAVETESKGEEEEKEAPVSAVSKRRSSASTERAAKRPAVSAPRPMHYPLPPPIKFRPIAEPSALVYPPSEPDSAPQSPRACPVFRPLVGDDDNLFLRLTPVCIPPSPRPCDLGASSPTDSDEVVPATPVELWPTFESVQHAYLGDE